MHDSYGLPRKGFAFENERFIPAAVQRLGYAAGRVYTFEEVAELRRKVDGFAAGFPLRGELDFRECFIEPELKEDVYEHGFFAGTRKVPNPEWQEAKAKAAEQPRSYPASAFVEYSRNHASARLGKFLMEELCLNPSVGMESWRLWYLPELQAMLADYHAVCVKRASAAFTTEIGG